MTTSNTMTGIVAEQGFESALNAAMNEAAKRGVLIGNYQTPQGALRVAEGDTCK